MMSAGQTITVAASVKSMQDAINKATENMRRMAEAMGLVTETERCDYSWLWPSECAHCLGHEPDWEEPRKKVVVYD